MKTLVFLIGPPAVGKMTVGRALEELTGLPLFHNHMTVDLVLPFFEFGSPPYGRLVGGIRRWILEEVAESDLPGLIFTYVWAFNYPSDHAFVESLVEIFTSRGGRAVFAELSSDLEVRLQRNETELRLREKPSKRDVEQSRARLLEAEEKARMISEGDFPYRDHLCLDTTHMEPEEAARRVAEAFGLPVVEDRRAADDLQPADDPPGEA